MFPSFPYFSLTELKEQCPSKQFGRSFKQELVYRKDCVQIILACGPPIKLHTVTLHKAVVLLHRFFTRCSSTQWTGLNKWALATACVFLATKIDSAYHRLESIVHVSYRALRELYSKPLEPEYYNPDGTPGNPKFLGRLSVLVREAETRLMFAINFDFNVEVATSMVIIQCNELGLTTEQADRDSSVFAVRKTAFDVAKASLESCSPQLASRSVSFLTHTARELSLACISKACRVHGVTLNWSSLDRRRYVPDIAEEQLAVVEDSLPRLMGESRPATPAVSSGNGEAGGSGTQQQQQRGRGQASAAANGAANGAPGSSGSGAADAGGSSPRCVDAAVATAEEAGGAKQGQGVSGVSVGDGSQAEAATAGPRMNPSPISPDSQTGPVGTDGRVGQQQYQQQQQCRKRTHSTVFGQALLTGAEKKSNVVAA